MTSLGRAILWPVLGLALGFIAHFFVTPRYVSTAVLEVMDANGDVDHSEWANRLRKERDEIISLPDLASLIADPGLQLYASHGHPLATEDRIEEMRRNLDIQINPYGMVRITFTYRDRMKTHMVVQAVVTRFVEHKVRIADPYSTPHRPADAGQAQRIAQLEARIAELEKHFGIAPEPAAVPAPFDGAGLAVIDSPSLPVSPVYPDPSWFSATGCGMGLLAAIAIPMLRRRNPAAPLLPQTV